MDGMEEVAMGKDPKYGLISLSLVLIISFSMLLIALPVSATSATAPSSPITVQQGKVFLLRGTITFDQADTGYFIWGPIYWYDNGDPAENFSLENIPSVYWTDGTPVENITIENYRIPNGWQVRIEDNGDGIARNGTFYVDIWLRAASGDGTPHKVGDQKIYFAMNRITLWEPDMVTVPAGPITIQVLPVPKGVDVLISPDFQENLPGENLAYTVTVKNIGSMPDNYNLTKGDNAGWGDNIWLENYQFLNVENGENRATTLHVHIPENAIRCTYNNIWVAATSVDNENVKDNDSCIAHVVVPRGVDVSISPSYQENVPGENVTFVVTVKNLGTENDNYDLTVSDDAGWGPSISPNVLTVPAGRTENATLKVTVPENLRQQVEDNIIVTATSRTDNTVKDNASCIAHSVIIRGAEVSISPAEKAGLRGRTLTYTVTVWNRGSIKDNFRLENKDNSVWPMALDNDRFDNMLPNENRPTMLRVTIPDNAAPSTRDNVRVIAVLVENENVKAENNCIAHLAQVTFTVSISPSFKSRFRGENLTYTVTVKNMTTDNVDFQDNYSLTIGDNSGWPLSLPENRIENVGRDKENSKTFTVTIPDNATPCTRDNVTITATSQADNRENRSGSCIAHSLAVYVSVTPSENSALPGDNLTYIVKVWSTSTSSENDNFRLTVSDNLGWSLSISPDNVKVSKDENGTAVLTVTVPENAVPCTRDNNITVTATSLTDNTVKGNASCIAHAGYAGVSVLITPENKEGFQGENLTYTVTVKNTGTIMDNFRLENLDTLGWPKALNNDRFDSVPPGENKEATLTVTVPWYFPPGTSDNITVRATSAENENVKDNDSCIAHSKLFEMTTYPIEDAHVREAAFGNNYGGDNLYVGMKDGGAARSFLKFRLPTVPVGWTVENAWLYLYAWSRYGGGENVQCHRVDDDGWSEGTITWDTQPSIGGRLDGPKPVLYPPPRPTLNSWDVTDFVRGQYQVDNKASFAMVGAGENVPPDHWVVFLSREVRGYEPYLKILYRPSRDWVDLVSIFRENAVENYAYDYPGRTVKYQVTVKNIGWENNSYRLENRDNSGWALTLDNARFDNVPPGENRVTTLRVKIPDNAASGTEDRITVRVTSVDNEYIWDENSCIARSVLPTVSISPSYNKGLRGENLRYDVWVTNPTTYSKSFKLTVEDNAGTRQEDNITIPNPRWYPTLDNFIIVPAESRGKKMLSVIVSWSSPPGTSDNIIVTATSTEDENVYTENSCIAYSMGLPGPLLYPTDDSYVWGKYPDNNYGMDEYLYVGREEDNAKEIFLKFDLRGLSLPAGSTLIDAKISLLSSDIVSGGENVQCYRVDNDNWTEGSITWNNSRMIGGALNGPVEVTTKKVWYSWDVSTFFLEQFENDKVMSLCLVGMGENRSPDHWARFDSENFYGGENRYPRLATGYRMGRYTPEVSISPENQSSLHGRNLIYQVIVKNVGWENATYILENTDNAGWPMTLENVGFNNVPPGENRKTKLTVTIPENALSCTEDNITVTAISIADNTMRDAASCLAHSLAVFISIKSPPCTSVVPGDKLTYTVYVWSTSTSENGDNFTLTKGDNQNWGLSISPETLTISAGENENATLVVTIPENALINTQDNIWVKATSQTDNTVFDNKSCLASAGYVDLEILPISQKSKRDFPGKELTYDVTIKNTGTVVENLELAELAADNENWAINYLQDYWLNVPPENSVDFTFKVVIPSDAAHSTTNNVTVKFRASVAPAVFTVNVPPDNDAYVDNSDPNTPYNTNNLFIEHMGTTSSTMSWLKFDLPSSPAGAEDFYKARLKLYFHTHSWVDNEQAKTGAYFSENDNWSENTITWNNMPPRRPTPTKSVILDTGWQSWDVTPNVRQELNGDNKVSWCLKNEGTGRYIERGEAYSKESTDNRPYLELIYENSRGGVSVKYATDNCTAQATHLKVSITGISPPSQQGLPGSPIEPFLITVKNDGLEKDSYHLTVVDDAGWENLKFDDDFLEDVENNKTSQTSLRVVIPDNATPGMRDNLKVIVTSWTDDTVNDNDSCTVLVQSFTRRARVSITPSYQENVLPGRSITFTVTVTNTGEVRDNFTLSASDNQNWSPSVSPSSLLLASGASGNATLTVRIPDNAAAYTRDNIRVIARSRYDNAVENENSCTVHVAAVRRGVRIEISPTENSAGPGGNVMFRVTVTNTGSVADNYVLRGSDNSGWPLSLSPSTLPLAAGALGTSTLTVTIPENTESCTRDRITVTARSLTDNTIENSANCTAHAIVSGVEVTISPSEDTGSPGETLTFTVTVKNTGKVEDSYDLTVSDDAGWGATLSENLLTIPAGENGIVVVSVTIPSDAINGDSTAITVTATSRGDPTKSDVTTCTATAGEKGPPGLPVLPLIVGTAAVGGGAVIALLLKKGIIHLPSLRSHSRRQILHML